jgi:O-antigen/teichoic acid export membrane protein
VIRARCRSFGLIQAVVAESDDRRVETSLCATSAAAGRLTSGVVWSIIAGVFAQGSTLLSSILAARLIGKESYGHLASVQATAIALTNLGSLGLGITATKYVSELRESDRERAGRILGLSSLVALAASTFFAVALLAGARVMAVRSLHAPELTAELRWSAIYVFFTTLNGYQTGALCGLESFRRLAQISLAHGVCSLACTLAGAYWLGERGAVLAFNAGALLLWGWYQFALLRDLRRFRIRIQHRGAWRERAALVRFALPATFSGVVSSISVWFCYCWLVRTRGFAEMAIYMAANNFRAAVSFTPNLVSRVTTPLLNNVLTVGNRRGGVRMFWLTVAGNTGLAIAVALVLLIPGPRLLSWFGKDFIAGRSLLALIMFATVMEVLSGSLYQAMFARRDLFAQIAAISVWAAVLVGVTCGSVARWGASGLAAAYVAGNVAAALMYLGPARSLGDGVG